MPMHVTTPPVELVHPATANVPIADATSVATVATANPQIVVETTDDATLSNANVLPDNVKKMLWD